MREEVLYVLLSECCIVVVRIIKRNRYSILLEIFYDDVAKEFYVNQPTAGNTSVKRFVAVTDLEYFCNKSWTASFNFNTKSWVSFHTYLPNFYIGENNFFYSGLNESCDISAIAVTEIPSPTTTTTTTVIYYCNLSGTAECTDCISTTTTTSSSTSTTTSTSTSTTTSTSTSTSTTTTTTTATPEPTTTTTTTTSEPTTTTTTTTITPEPTTTTTSTSTSTTTSTSTSTTTTTTTAPPAPGCELDGTAVEDYPTGNFITTEGGDPIITEGSNNLIIE